MIKGLSLYCKIIIAYVLYVYIYYDNPITNFIEQIVKISDIKTMGV